MDRNQLAMSKETLSKGHVFARSENDVSYDRVKHLSGMPRPYWDAKPDTIAFQTFKQVRHWNDEKSKARTFLRKDQQDLYEEAVMAVQGKAANDWPSYAGLSWMVSSSPTDHMAKRIVAILANKLWSTDPYARVLWVDANQRTPFGRLCYPDWSDPNGHDLVVVTGLVPDPTTELKSAVRGWYEWAIRFAPCFLVGAGADPVEIATWKFGIKTDFYFYGYAPERATSVKTAG